MLTFQRSYFRVTHTPASSPSPRFSKPSKHWFPKVESNVALSLGLYRGGGSRHGLVLSIPEKTVSQHINSHKTCRRAVSVVDRAGRRYTATDGTKERRTTTAKSPQRASQAGDQTNPKDMSLAQQERDRPAETPTS